MAANDQLLRSMAEVTTAKFDVDWDAVFTQELPRVYNYLRYRLGDNALAEDITAATFEKAWRARERYRRDLAGLSTWLLTIARNAATDHLRSHRVHLPLDTLRQVPAPELTEVIVMRQADLARLTLLLGQLPDRERELIALKYGAQLNNREIARHAGLSESNVGTMLHRIVTRLRSDWDK